jgi:hypothetical protein
MEQTAEEFWRSYEERTGEKVLARNLGRYLSGWDEFDAPGGRPLWGLLIATDGGFRFHHFPQVNWFDALSRLNRGWEAPQEKTFFIPRDRISAAELGIGKNKWQRFFAFRPPLLKIRYRNDQGLDREIRAETDSKSAALAEQLRAFSL